MKKPPKQTLTTGHGSVSAHEVLTLREFGRRLGLANRALCDAQRAGLRTVLVGRTKFVVGSHALEWFAKLADEQAERVNGNGGPTNEK